MKAVYYEKYGGPEVFDVREIETPIPKQDEVLIRVICTTVNRTDTGMTSAMYFVSRFFTGLFSPQRKVPGTDFSGVVEKIGSEVKSFKVGDAVIGFDDNILSSQAEFMVMKEGGNIVLKPVNVTHEDAVASIEGAHYALNVYQKAKTKKGDQILVYGATGAIGTAAVQLAGRFPAEVQAVANTKNIELVKSLGASKVYDYQTEDFTVIEDRFDLIFDAVGKSSFKACKKLLKKDGVYISTELGKNGINIWLALTNKHVRFPFPSNIKQTLENMSKLLSMKLYRPVIDRSFPLEKVQDAYRYVSSGQKTGNVILKIAGV